MSFIAYNKEDKENIKEIQKEVREY